MRYDRPGKRLLRTFFFDFLRLFETDLAQRLDAGHLVLVDKELLGATPHEKRHEVDVLVRSRLRGERAEFLIHVELQAQHQKDFPRRMFGYCARLHETHRLPVYPMAILGHTSPGALAPDVYEMAVNGRRVVHFQFRAIQLNALRWQDYRDVLNPVAAALMARMRMERAERARVKWACYDLTARLNLSEDHALVVLEFVEVYLPLNEREQAEFEAYFRAANPGIQEVVMKFSNQWVEKGWREGVREGEQIGIQKGEQIGIQKGRRLGIQEGEQKGEQRGRQAQALDLLVRLLGQRVGPVPEATRARLAGLPVETLVAMAEGIFTVHSFDDLQRWL